MSVSATPDPDGNEPSRPRRRYDSSLRRERAAETRERIVAAGSALVHDFPRWDWRGLTFRAVAERAGVGERTVYRHFGTERELHDAVMHRLQEEAGVSYAELGLDDIADVTARAFATLSSFAVARWAAPDPQQPALVAENQRRHDALIGAVGPSTDDWSDTERRAAAAMLDVLWSVPAYECLITAWNLDSDQATRTVGWVIDLVVGAIRAGRRPDLAGPDG